MEYLKEVKVSRLFSKGYFHFFQWSNPFHSKLLTLMNVKNYIKLLLLYISVYGAYTFVSGQDITSPNPPLILKIWDELLILLCAIQSVCRWKSLVNKKIKYAMLCFGMLVMVMVIKTIVFDISFFRVSKYYVLMFFLWVSILLSGHEEDKVTWEILYFLLPGLVLSWIIYFIDYQSFGYKFRFASFYTNPNSLGFVTGIMFILFYIKYVLCKENPNYNILGIMTMMSMLFFSGSLSAILQVLIGLSVFTVLSLIGLKKQFYIGVVTKACAFILVSLSASVVLSWKFFPMVLNKYMNKINSILEFSALDINEISKLNRNHPTISNSLTNRIEAFKGYINDLNLEKAFFGTYHEYIETDSGMLNILLNHGFIAFYLFMFVFLYYPIVFSIKNNNYIFVIPVLSSIVVNLIFQYQIEVTITYAVYAIIYGTIYLENHTSYNSN